MAGGEGVPMSRPADDGTAEDAIQAAADPNASRRLLTEAERFDIFKTATRSFVRWYGDRFAAGMTDEELSEALEAALGIFGGSGGPGRPSIAFTGSGLRIWGGRHIVNHVTEKPLFAGKATIAMARRVYAIPDPGDRQLDLF